VKISLDDLHRSQFFIADFDTRLIGMRIDLRVNA